MRNSNRHNHRQIHYSVRQAACVLCVDVSVVARAIRVGTLPTTVKGGRRVIPASALTRLLGPPQFDTANGQEVGTHDRA